MSVLAAVVLATVSSCSSNPVDAPPPTIPAASPAAAPPQTQVPAGVVRPVRGPVQAAAFDAGTSALVLLMPGADARAAATLTVLEPGGAPPRVIALPGPASAITASGDGEVLLPTRGGYFIADVGAGTVRPVGVTDQSDTDFTAIARRADGKLVLGTGDGAVFILGSPTSVGQQVKIFARVDSIVTQGNTAVVLDRGQTSVTTVDADGQPQQALRAGEGATTMAVDPAGRVLVADTRGDELLVFGVDPLILRQRFPVPSSPYGLTGSASLAWVSQTAANVVVGYDLATGIPVEKVRYPTVQQPDMLAFDAATDTLYVVSGSGAGVQVIDGAGKAR